MELAKAYKAKSPKTVATSVYKFKQSMKMNVKQAKQYSQLKNNVQSRKDLTPHRNMQLLTEKQHADKTAREAKARAKKKK